MGNRNERIDIIHRTLRYSEAGTTHMEPEMLRNPVSHYADLSEELRAKKARYWEANHRVVRTIFGEDFAIGEGIQQGLATGLNEHFVIGQFEAGIQLPEKAIDDALVGRLVCPQTLMLSE